MTVDEDINRTYHYSATLFYRGGNSPAAENRDPQACCSTFFGHKECLAVFRASLVVGSVCFGAPTGNLAELSASDFVLLQGFLIFRQ